MARGGRTTRLALIIGLVLSAGGAAVLTVSGLASASATLTVTPNTGIVLGSVVSVSTTGLPDNTSGFLLECNNDPTQPTITALGNTFPVGCSDPNVHPVTTSASGALGPLDFTVVEGTVGPPATGQDSNGNEAFVDTVSYPCPPTPAQVAIGDSCDIQFGDAQGVDLASADLSFGPAMPAPTTTTTATVATTTTPTFPTTTPTTSTPTTTPMVTTPTTKTGVTTITAIETSAIVASSGTTKTVLPDGTLAFTGAGPGLWMTAIAGLLLLNLGYLLLILYRRPRELLQMAGHRISRIFGGR